MRHRSIKAGVGALSAAVLAVGLAASPASADAGLGAGTTDTVGVGSDTVQYAIDFLADGDYVGDPGWNSAGNAYRLVNFDATPDANARLAYGPDGASGSALPQETAPSGLGGSAGAASSGTGFGGSGNAAAGTYFWVVTASVLGKGESVASNEVTNAVTSGQSETLSWSAVADATSYKIYRGTATGAENKLVGTVSGSPPATTFEDLGAAGSSGTPPTGPTNGCAPGTGGSVGTGNNTVDTAGFLPCTLNPTIVVRELKPPFQRPNGSGAGATAMLNDEASGKHYIDFFRASSAQGSKFPTCVAQPTKCVDSVTIGIDPLRMLKTTTPASHAIPLSNQELNSIYNCSITTWSALPGAPGGTSTNTIIPIVPQVGSGTRSSFLGAISVTTPGSCVKVAEENDPTALAAQSSPADAIEPMSGGRLNMFQGKDGSGTSISSSGYFKDPSCALEQFSSVCGTVATNPIAPAINPQVALIANGSNASDGNPIFGIDRNLYVYFRDADVNAAGGWEPGTTTNKIRTLFYNPCSGAGCTGFGPGGAPYIDQTAGQGLISSAGISPTYSVTLGGA